MKKAIWFTGIFVLAFILLIGGYLLLSYGKNFFHDKSSKMPEGTFVEIETGKTLCADFDMEHDGMENYCVEKHDTQNRCPLHWLTQTERMWNTWQRSA